MNEAHKKLRELIEKGNKQGRKKDQTMEKNKEVENSRFKQKYPIVMLARDKDLLKEHDNKTPILLLAYVFYTNHSTYHIFHYISLVYQEFHDIFPKKIP